MEHTLVILALGMILTAVVLASFGGSGPDTQRASLVTGYASLVALLVTVVLGPLRIVRAQPNPVSSDLRRDIGIAAALTGLAHVVLATRHHFGGSLRLYFFVDGRLRVESVRTDAFGWGVWIGAAATVVLGVLGALSNDASLRTLGRRRWKAIQRGNYALVPLAVAHTALFWYALGRDGLTETLLVLAIFCALALQCAGVVRLRSSDRVRHLASVGRD